MSKNVFIGENQEQSVVYDSLVDILDTVELRRVAKSIFSEVQNNKVGYFIFKDGDIFFKIFVLPKHIKLPDEGSDELETIKKLIEYMKIHYRLQNSYPKYRNDGIQVETAIELTFDSHHAIYQAQNLEQLIFYKYESLLLSIKKFFDNHKAVKKELTQYASQTIRYKFDLAKNIRELDKTRIHQKKYKSIIYSDIANIAYGAIKLFLNNKVELMDEEASNKQALIKLSKDIQTVLQQKFNVDSSNRITLPRLIGSKTYRYFKKKAIFMPLYSNILALFGIENIFDEVSDKDINRNTKTEALLIDPALLYEWYVYDQIKHSRLIQEEGYSIASDKNEGTAKSYIIKGDYRNEEVTSNPDIIVSKDNEAYIIDVKWKRIDKKPVALNDMLKLKRDTEIRSLDANVYAILIYNSIEKDRVVTEYLFDGEVPTFIFYATQMPYAANNTFNIDNFNTIAIPNSSVDSMIVDFNVLKETTRNNLDGLNVDIEVVHSIIEQQLLEQSAQLEKKLYDKFAEEDIRKDDECHKLQEFVNASKDILESECVSFIRSAISTTYYFHNFSKQDKKYDYSLPASGIWKAIEVELNASVIFLLRYMARVCDRSCYYVKLEGSNNDYIQTGAKWHQRIFLTDSKKTPGRMDNILLGSFPHLFKNLNSDNYDENKTLNVFSPVYQRFYSDSGSIEDWSNLISNFLFDIISIRNPHTHKDLMSRETYDEFLDYVLNNDQFSFSDLIDLKKNIIEYINDTSPN